MGSTVLKIKSKPRILPLGRDGYRYLRVALSFFGVALMLCSPLALASVDSTIDSLVKSAEVEIEDQVNGKLSKAFPEAGIWIKVSLDLNRLGFKAKLRELDPDAETNLPGLTYLPRDTLLEQRLGNLKAKDVLSGVSKVKVLAFSTLELSDAHKGFVQELISIHLPNVSPRSFSYSYKAVPRLERPKSEADPKSELPATKLPPKEETKNWFLEHIGAQNLKYLLWFVGGCVGLYFLLSLVQLVALFRSPAKSAATSAQSPPADSSASQGRSFDLPPLPLGLQPSSSGGPSFGGDRLKELIQQNPSQVNSYLNRISGDGHFSEVYLISSKLPQAAREEWFSGLSPPIRKAYDEYLLYHPVQEDIAETTAQKFELFLQSEGAFVADKVRDKFGQLEVGVKTSFLRSLEQSERQLLVTLLDDRAVAELVQLGCVKHDDILLPTHGVKSLKFLEALHQKAKEYTASVDTKSSLAKIVKVGWFMDVETESKSQDFNGGSHQQFTTKSLVEEHFDAAAQWIDALSLDDVCSLFALFSEDMRTSFMTRMPEIKRRRIQARGFVRNERSGDLKFKLSQTLFARADRSAELESNEELNHVA